MLDRLSVAAREQVRKIAQPQWIDPMLATLTEKHFSNPDWIFERKLDGVRTLVFHEAGRVRLMSRNRNKMNVTYPELVEALEQQTLTGFIADGEIVAFDGDVTSFARLQGRLGIKDASRARRSNIAVFLYLFDILYLEGHDVSQVPQRERKVLLKAALQFDDPLRYTEHRNEEGDRYLAEACRRGWEGLIAKHADAPYEQRRSRQWLKFKCVSEQELVIIGYTDPAGSRIGFGALLVGYYESDRLRYAGKVGTGYNDKLLRELGGKLKAIERATSPVAGTPPRIKGAHWVEPKLVAQVGFTEWTRDGKLRHPRFVGLRHDKKPQHVVRERSGS